METIAALPEVKSVRGYELRLLKETDGGFIYEMRWKEDLSLVHGYEVFKRRVRDASEAFGRSYPKRYEYPSSEDFGVWAWACSTLERALVVLSEIDSGVR